jgi:hypothetical protein
MTVLTRMRLYQVGILCMLVVAVGCAALALSLLAGTITGNGSREGDIIRIGFGLLLLFASFLFVFFSSVLRNSSKSRCKTYVA